MSRDDTAAGSPRQLEDLRSPDKNVRARAALEIGKLADAGSTDALIEALSTETDFFVGENLTWALVRLGRAPLEPLQRLLSDGPALARHRAAHVLSKIADPSTFDALVAALADDELSVLSKAVFALGQIGNPRAIPALVPLLAYRSRELQSMLAGVLARFGSGALPQLHAALGSDDAHYREHAAYVLGQIGSEEAVPALARARRDESWEVRFAAAYALGEIGGQRAGDALRGMRQDLDARVCELVGRLLERPSYYTQ
jgi:HEAT repeat protein